MIIANSQVNMCSKRYYQSSSNSSLSLNSWDQSGSKSVNLVSGSFFKESYSESSGDGLGNLKSGSDNAQSQLEDGIFDQRNMSFGQSMDKLLESKANAIRANSSRVAEESVSTKVQFQSLNYLLHILFGKMFGADSEWASYLSDISDGTGSLAGAQNPGGGITYSEYNSEEEITSFSTKATVTTADGRQIDINLNLQMTRAFEETYSEAYEWGAKRLSTCDPLVINLESTACHVSDQTFVFDIDADGVTENVAFPTDGSGFLALDKNGDGTINDGSELFGTESQNGFADLAVYDEDGNGWIDEADSVFKNLMIYTKDSNGNDKLTAIGKAGVGAIYLGSSTTDFSLTKDSAKGKSADSNEVSAYVRRTGFFLYENGTAGTIQHVDFVKQG